MVGTIEQNPGAADAKWTGTIFFDLKRYPSYKDAVGLDGEAIELEWKIRPRVTILTILKEIQMDMGRKNIEPEKFKYRIIFMSMFNDIEWKMNDTNCISNAEKVKNHSQRFPPGHWLFSVQVRKRDGRETLMMDNGDRTANKMVKNLVILSSQVPVL